MNYDCYENGYKGAKYLGYHYFLFTKQDPPDDLIELQSLSASVLVLKAPAFKR